MEVSKLGVLIPTAKPVSQGENLTLPIPKGPGKGNNLAPVGGATPQLIGCNAAKELWEQEELKCHMLSPKGKNKQWKEPRTDFSPVRKQLFKGFHFLL